MARSKGSKNKPKLATEAVLMSAEARIELLANLLVERLLEEKIQVDMSHAT